MARLRHAEEILALRLQAQGLLSPITKSAEYLDLFSELSPLAPKWATRPGNPPVLQHRTLFDDELVGDVMRSDRKIVKGRFCSGGVSYVTADDLAMHATTFAKPMTKPNEIDEQVLEAICTEGPFSPRQIKEQTGILVKDISKSLNKLSRAFLVYEDQVDDEWSRGFHDFSAEWPDVEIADYARDAERWLDVAAEVIGRFCRSRVFATFDQIRDWSGLPVKRLKEIVGLLERTERIAPIQVTGLGEGWIVPDTPDASANHEASLFIMHRGDPLVRAEAGTLKELFKGHDVLQYILRDGVFDGAVIGRWGINPYDVDDVIFLPHVPANDIARRKDEVIEKVREEYPEPRHNVRRFGGKRI